MKLYVRAFQFKLDKAGYINALKEAVQQEFRNALYAFLEVAEHRIPVDSGQARGSLKPLADFAGYTLDLHDAHPQPNKGPDTGLGQTNVTFDWPSLSISFMVEIDYMEMLERTGTYPHSKSGKDVTAKGAPWLAFAHGRRAFVDHLERHLKGKIPRVTDFLTRTSIGYSR